MMVISRMKNVLVISGLGADKRVFRKIRFPDDWKVSFLVWKLVRNDESLNSYTERLYLSDKKRYDIIIGLSFGSIIAQELHSVYMRNSELIIISGIVEKEQIPFRMLLRPLIKIIPPSVYNKPLYPIKKLFGIKSEESYALWRSEIEETDTVFAKWAVIQILKWEPPSLNTYPKLIHGENDLLIKQPKTVQCTLISNAGHFMIYEQAEIISNWINENGG